MANIIGGIAPYPGTNNHLIGTDEFDFNLWLPLYLAFPIFSASPRLAFDITQQGRGGDDDISGGEGIDFLVGDAWNMTYEGRGGNDQLSGGEDLDFIFGDSFEVMSGSARGGNDIIFGDAGDDDLVGDGFAMTNSARGGNDTIDGGPGNDKIQGDAGFKMHDSARGGNDDGTSGGEGDDQIFGDAWLYDNTRGAGMIGSKAARATTTSLAMTSRSTTTVAPEMTLSTVARVTTCFWAMATRCLAMRAVATTS